MPPFGSQMVEWRRSIRGPGQGIRRPDQSSDQHYPSRGGVDLSSIVSDTTGARREFRRGLDLAVSLARNAASAKLRLQSPRGPQDSACLST